MALQQEGWGAIGNLITSATHNVASKIKGAHFRKEFCGSNNGLGAAVVVSAIVVDGAKMAMQTRNTSTSFIGDMLKRLGCQCL